VKRLNAEIWDGVESVSAIGPGKPYRSIPAGSTGETRAATAGCVGVMTGTGLGTATGAGAGGGIDGLGTEGAAPGVEVDVGVGWFFDERANIKALSDAPAAADDAATMARVVLDMLGTNDLKSETRLA